MSILTVAAKYKDVLTICFSVLSFIIACTSLFFQVEQHGMIDQD